MAPLNREHSTNIQEAWSRFLNDSYTDEDLSLILDSLKEDENFQAFYEASNKEWNLADTFRETEGEKEAYRLQAARLLAEYEGNRRIRPAQSPVKKMIRRRSIYYAAAAAMVVCLFLSGGYFYLKSEPEQISVPYIEARSNRGEVKTVFLPDNTKVTLNAESSIKYPAVFPAGERSAELAGEALFEVTSDRERPFTVTTEKMEIKVLGTVFDVKAYTDDLSTSVSVASGKVEVNLADGKVLLERDQQVKMNKTTGNFEKLTIDADKYLLWTDGTLYFNRTPIKEVVNMLNRHYPQIDIELAEGEYTNLISGEHDNKCPEAVLTSIIYSTGLKYKKGNNKYILHQNN